MATEVVLQYKLDRPLTNEGAGYCVWGFGTKNGSPYFIKQFLSPKYPVNDKESTPEQLAKRKRKCDNFINKKIAVYNALNTGSDGNDVRVREFFRVGPRFYIAMDKVDDLKWTVADIHRLTEPEKRHLCAVIAHAIWGLHRRGLVHADLKHENILYTRTPAGTITAKVIDFDNSYLESDPPAPKDIVGDINYYAPETCARLNEVDCALTRQVDIFALGVLFHQYFTGKLPGFSRESFDCPGIAVLGGGQLELDPDLPKDVAALLNMMLSADPQNRPTAWEVFCSFHPEAMAIPEPAEDDFPAPPVPVSGLTPTPDPWPVSAVGAGSAPAADNPSSFFRSGGNLPG